MIREFLALKSVRLIILTALTFGVSIVITEKLLVSVFDFFEERSYDLRYNYFISEKLNTEVPDDIVLIAIDEESLEKLGRFQQWPRSYIAQVIENLAQDKPAAVFTDILFIEHDQDSLQDSLLVHAAALCRVLYSALNLPPSDTNIKREPSFEKFRPEFLPEEWHHISYTFEQLDIERASVSGPFKELAEASKGFGFINLGTEGVIRSVPLFFTHQGVAYPAISTSIAMDILGITPDKIAIRDNNYLNLGNHAIPIDEKCHISLRYLGPYKTSFRNISFLDVFEGKVAPDSFHNKIVIIGASAAGLGDLKTVPFGTLPGMEIQATAIHNLLTGNVIREAGTLTGLAITLILVFIVILFTLYLSPRYSAVLLGVIVIIYFLFNYFAFEIYSLCVELIRPEFSAFLAFLVAMTTLYATEMREKTRISTMFRHYVSDEVVSELIQNPETLVLGGRSMELTILFLDIANFTSLSENLSPEESIQLLNLYLGRMTEIILTHHGMLDKYLGDGLMAVFGAPKPRSDHALCACRASLEMIKAFERLSDNLKRTHDYYITSRIGIASGLVVAGNLGSSLRMDYTVIGDTVNVASRLEGLNKMFGTRILISETTKSLTDDAFTTRELDRVRLRGKVVPLTAYELIAEGTISPKIQERIDIFEEALKQYRKKEFSKALASFELLREISPEDKALDVFTGRIDFLMKNPPPDTWTDGAWPIFDRRKSKRASKNYLPTL